tara:strand:- start:1371 stop:2129 length:759 start_codon:yes stop_codon:yes gene_type:complete
MKYYVHQHLGLGDMILCNGLIRHLISLKPYSKFYLFCKNSHLKSIKFMYRDIKNISLIGVRNNSKGEIADVKNHIAKIRSNFELIKIGHEFYHTTNSLNIDKENPWPCDVVFYKQFEIPFSYRFKKSYWKRDITREKKVYKNIVGKKKNYIFIHDDPSRNIFISDKLIKKKYHIVRNNYKYSIFDYAMILEKAKEIHLIESSFRQIVETLNTKNIKLFLYKNRPGDHSISLYNKKLKKWVGTQKKWKVVSYK